MRLGYKLMSEELGPRALVSNAIRAEEVGFDLAAISDHYFPWLEEEGHAPFIWTVLGAIAMATEKIDLMTAVTCPTFRYHPAIVAQAATTVSLLAGRRFRLGLGSGERLNEHVIGAAWPGIREQQQRMAEALDIIKGLLAGTLTRFEGTFFRLDRARLFDRPRQTPLIVVAAGGREAARLAGRKADGLIVTQPQAELAKAYAAAGGHGLRFAEIAMCYAETEAEARRTVHRYNRWSMAGAAALVDLPHTKAFADATNQLSPEQTAEDVSCGPAPEPHLEAIHRYLQAGFDHVILTQIGPDQDGFCRFFERELRPRLRRRAAA